MKKLLIVVLYLTPSLLFAATTISIATPGHPINNPLKEESISTSQIDAVLGSNHASNLVDGLFTDLADLKSDLENGIRDAILSADKTKSVLWTTAAIDPISATLSQQSTSVSLMLEGVSVSFKAKADGGFFCPTVTYTAEIQNIEATGNYDVYTGLLSGPNITHNDINVTSASCSGIFGLLINLFGGVDGRVEGELDNAIGNLAGVNSMTTLFSIRDLAADLANIVFTQNETDKALMAVDEIINSTDLDSGIELKVVLDRDFNGTNQHKISFEATQQRPSLLAEFIPNGTTLAIVGGTNAEKYELYRKFEGSTVWEHVLTTSESINYIFAPAGSQLMAVATNDLIPGLKSFPTTTEVLQSVICDPNCIFVP